MAGRLIDICERLSIALLFMIGSSAFCPAATHRKVLIIYSYNNLMPWQTRIRAGMQERLEQISPDARPDIYEENVDSARLNTAVTGPALTTYLRTKYTGLNFDTVIAESSAATQVLIANPDLFASARRYAIDPGIEVPTPSSGIDIIQTQGDWAGRSLLTVATVMPGLRRLIAVTDVSAVGQTNKRKLLAAASSLPSNIAFEVWDDFSFGELFDRSAHLPPDAALFYTPVFRDRTGARETPQILARSLAERSAAPMFAYHDLYLGQGIVGGRLLSSQRVGAMMADMALGPSYAERWTHAESLLNPYMFDDAILRRWNISRDRLPASSIIVGQDVSVWRRYCWQIGGTLTAVLLQGCLIIWLITALRQRNAAVHNVIVERDGLELKVAERTRELFITARRLEASNTHLQYLADTDPLTSVANRRKFLACLEGEWQRTVLDESSLSLLMIDVDRFKSVNDRHGHDAGDEVIRGVAEVCRAHMRETDCVGRLGGEEFAILLPGSDRVVASACAERIRQAVGGLQIELQTGPAISVTVSIGVSWRRGASDTPACVMARADTALYDAKHAGRDRVICSSDSRSASAADAGASTAVIDHAA